MQSAFLARRLASGRFFLLPMLLLLALSGCATPLSTALRESPPAGPRQAELTDTPFFPQVDALCGPAALATVLRRAGGTQSPEQLVPQVYLPGRKGSLQIEMLTAARRGGKLATVIPGSFDALLAEIRAGNAVLVLQNLGLDFAPSWHYAVIIGYDLDAEEFILRSGPEPRMRMGFPVFERTWTRAGRWAAVVTPSSRLPVSAQLPEVASSLAALERLDPLASVDAYLTAIRRWPEHTNFQVGHANALFNSGDMTGAADALFKLLAVEPDNAVALNNLANIRIRFGDLVSARRFAERAAKHPGPWQAAAQQTLADIEQAEADAQAAAPGR